MSRIRSIHPGLWTDERFVTATPMARLFFMGLWNECDDYGSFEWSPLKLKMRLLPADNADAGALLIELEDAGSVLKYEVAGKVYGAVRNFCQYQRPKKPNSTFPQTDKVREWVNREARSSRDGEEPVPNQLPTASEIGRQMEEEGDKGSSEANASGSEAADPVKDLFDLGVALLTATGSDEKQARSLLGKWRKAKGEAEVLQALLDCRARSISNPVEWLTKRFQGGKWVSPKGFEYRGTDQQVLREAEKRNDMTTYWAVKRAMKDHATAAN